MKRPKVLLIGWDAADWKVITPLMDQGKMPNVQRLIESGVMGSIATLKPALSPMLWTSIATGKRPFKHGIHGFAEPTPDGLGIRPVTNLSRTVRAIWNILQLRDLRTIVCGWWPSHPAEPISGVMVSNHYHEAHRPSTEEWPLMPGSVHPPELQEQLAALRFHPDEVTVEMIEPFIPRVREIDQDKDRRLAGLMRTLCECVSMHAAATWLMEHEPCDLMAVYYDAIDHFCHGFMRYHAPRQDHVSERDFELYSGVVNAAYQFHDQMLGGLLRLAGDDTTVILMSDHGFHPDHLRLQAIPDLPAGPAIEHRDFGILAMRGPNIRKDELIHGANLLDITPTLLTLFDLPVGEDMDGKVLTAAFEQPPPVHTIPSWEDVPGVDGRHPPDRQLDPVASQEALEQLVALGYIARPDDNLQKAVADTVMELRYNLAEAYQDDDRHGDALEIYRDLHAADPNEQRFAVHRFIACQALGLLDEMREIVQDLDIRRRALYEEAQTRVRELDQLAKARRDERATPPSPGDVDPPPAPEPSAPRPSDAPGDHAQEAVRPEPLLTDAERKDLVRWRHLCRFNPVVVDYLKAQLKAMEGFPGAALDLLEGVQEAQLSRPGLFLQTADLYVKLERFDDAERTYARALEVDPDNPHAHVGMCRMALVRHDFESAADSALEAIQRLYHYPLAHFFLGVALSGLGRYERAAEAFRAALALNPNFWQAHRRLAALLRRRLHDPVAADEHLRLAHELRAAVKTSPAAEPSGASVPSARVPPVIPAFVPAAEPPPPEDGPFITVVAGLPRSGTSMIMQMLAAGGMPVLTDDLRAADEDNPSGYLEFEPATRLHQDAEWLKGASSKAVKIIAPLLPYLPLDRPYRVVFIERNLDEVIASQGQMLLHRGEDVQDTPARRARLIEQYARTVSTLKAHFTVRPRTTVLWLNHADVVLDPSAAAAAINRFLGGSLDIAAMAAQVKPALHRQRATPGQLAMPSSSNSSNDPKRHGANATAMQ